MSKSESKKPNNAQYAIAKILSFVDEFELECESLYNTANEREVYILDGYVAFPGYMSKYELSIIQNFAKSAFSLVENKANALIARIEKADSKKPNTIQ